MTKRITGLLLSVIMILSVFYVGSISASAASTTEDYAHRFIGSDTSWTETIKLNSVTKVTIDLNTPVFEDGTKASFSLDINRDDKKESLWLTKYENSNKSSYKYEVYLKKGTYTIKTYIFGLYEHTYADTSYKLTLKKNWKPSTPKLTQTIKKTKKKYFTTYTAKITWDKKDKNGNFKYSNEYDNIEVYLKKDSGKFKKERTLFNFSSSYYYGVTLTYYNNAYMYFYKVRAYKELKDGTKVYSKYSNILYTKTNYKPEKPYIYSITSPKKKQAVLKWWKVNDSSGYVVYRSTNKKKGFKKVATLKSKSKITFKNKKLKSKKTYYYKIKSYKIVNKVKLYSSFSKLKKIKIK